MVALAAGLWLVYLMPTWFKRREYAALEKTNIRRQQALRVLAGDRADSGRGARRADRDALWPDLGSRQARRGDQAVAGCPGRPRRQPAVRRGVDGARAGGSREASDRATASSHARVAFRCVLIAAIVTIVVQVVLMVTTGVAAGAWTVLGFCCGRRASCRSRRSVGSRASRVAAQPIVDAAGRAPGSHSRCPRNASPCTRAGGDLDPVAGSEAAVPVAQPKRPALHAARPIRWRAFAPRPSNPIARCVKRRSRPRSRRSLRQSVPLLRRAGGRAWVFSIPCDVEGPEPRRGPASSSRRLRLRPRSFVSFSARLSFQLQPGLLPRSAARRLAALIPSLRSRPRRVRPAIRKLVT